ncbi:hypothetical protein NPIL_434651, partial [Nephila pilipes]
MGVREERGREERKDLIEHMAMELNRRKSGQVTTQRNRRATGSNVGPKERVRHGVCTWCSQNYVMESRFLDYKSQDCPGAIKAALEH